MIYKDLSKIIWTTRIYLHVRTPKGIVKIKGQILEDKGDYFLFNMITEKNRNGTPVFVGKRMIKGYSYV